jgi:hypothetical protein
MEDKYIIVEGEQDRRLLAAILPQLAVHAKLVSADGYSAALSKAATVLSYLHKDALLALDADTTDERVAAEKKQFVNDYLKSSRNGNRFELVLFKPTLLDRLLGDDEWFTNEDKRLARNLRLVKFWNELSNNPTSFTRYQDLPALQEIRAFAGV